MTDVLLDTNLFIYAYDRTAVHHSRSVQVFTNPNNRLFTTAKNVAECVAVMTKLNFPQADIEQVLSDTLNNIQILYSSDASLRIFEQLFKTYKPRGNKVYDLEVASVVLAHNIAQVATFNTADFLYIAGIQLYPV
ncbi:MAG: PIN domain-containing protein [Haliscomenobacteraceae bacterium CHB4]|nr:tRNA(fMet)-specific endonuclease VapC [Saprospiraceae bacterium]MCE7924908.1 PIN domain-containing protein [Haliscomenobacteraceae bacterium CHB4]